MNVSEALKLGRHFYTKEINGNEQCLHPVEGSQ